MLFGKEGAQLAPGWSARWWSELRLVCSEPKEKLCAVEVDAAGQALTD